MTPTLGTEPARFLPRLAVPRFRGAIGKGASHPAGHGDVYYEEAQRIGAAAGAYVRSSESGSIELFPNYGRSAIESLVLRTKTT